MQNRGPETEKEYSTEPMWSRMNRPMSHDLFGIKSEKETVQQPPEDGAEEEGMICLTG